MRAVAHLARIRYRLLLVNVLVAAVPLVGISFARLHESQLLAALEHDMIDQAELVRALVEHGATADEPALIAAAYQTHTRIRLLDAHGAVTADSHRNGPPEGEEPPEPSLWSRGDRPARAARTDREPVELTSRREVRAALAGRYGAATRVWGHQDRVYLFSALPIRAAGAVTGVVYVTRSTHDVRLQLYDLRQWLIHVLIATIALTSLLTLLLATTIARPLGRLTRRAQRIAARQPVEPDTLTSRSDELGQLARAVAAMTAELERRARDARSLAADLSHEFKTPLTGIRGAAELLRDGADEPADRDRFLVMILDDAARLDRLVSRLLDLARVEDDRAIELPVDLAALAHTCASRAWPVPVRVTVVGDARTSGRATQLASALDNLVANATHFAASETSVDILIERRGAALRLTVANHGPALSAAARTRVWDRFYSTRAHAGGSGLGLAIVRSVALAHAGRVGIDCTAGITRFWLELPARPG